MNARLPLDIVKAATLGEVLRNRAQETPDRPAYRFLADRARRQTMLTFGDLDHRARIIADFLASTGQPGDRVLLFYPPGHEYLCAFFGCLYAGMIATPLYPPRPNQKQYRASRVIADCGARVALSQTDALPAISAYLDSDRAAEGVELFATDILSEGHADNWRPPNVSGTDLAFLQYTSGSTGTPKGVMVSHGNLLANEETIRQAFGTSPMDRVVSWLPLYHDMGLIGTALHSIYVGFESIMMPSMAFIQDPALWLEQITKYRATLAGAPNFAYELCLRKVTAERMEKLDLSEWRVAFNGAEPIRAATMNRFRETFAHVGFNTQALYPCYGMAEATLFVTGGSPEEAFKGLWVDPKTLERNEVRIEEDGQGTLLTGCGRAHDGHEIQVVDPTSGDLLPEGRVGEIWTAGPSIAQGYWNRPELSQTTFNAYLKDGRGPFLRTADLGFIQHGELYVTGRLKDLIIIRGRNYYAQDIEWTVSSLLSAFREDCCAAFSVQIGNEERLVVVQEVVRKRVRDIDAAAVIEQVRNAVGEHHELPLYAVVLVMPGAVPKTSSGKIQRFACREAFLANSLRVVGSDVMDENHAPREEPVPERDELLALIPDERKKRLESIFHQVTSNVFKRGLAKIDPDVPLNRMGIDSIMAVELQHRIESSLKVSVPLSRILSGSSSNDLAAAAMPLLEIPASIIEPIEEVDTGFQFPLSHNQQTLWFLHKLAPTSSAYNISFALTIKTELNIPLFRGYFHALIARHAALRSTISVQNGVPTQMIHESLDLHFSEINIVGWNERRVDEFIDAEAQQPFNLESGPHLRLNMLKRASDDHILVLTAHHIAIDFWSILILMDELQQLYINRHPFDHLPELKCTYADFVQWQQRRLEDESLWHFWRDRLAGDLPVLRLTTDYPRPEVQSYRGDSFSFSLDSKLSNKIRKQALKHQTTLFVYLLSAYQTLLHRHTDQNDILVGSPATGRSRTEFEGLIGYFVNPVVLRADFSENPKFSELLAATRSDVFAALEHQDFPFQLLVERLQPDREPSRTPIFQTMFVLQKPQRLKGSGAFALRDAPASMKWGEWEIESKAIRQRVSQFDLTLFMAETDDGIKASLEYNTDLFKPETIKRLSEHFITLLHQMAADPDQSVQTYPILSLEERHLLLHQWRPERQTPLPGCVHQWFEAHAAKNPHAPALYFGSGEDAITPCLDYDTLNRRANQLARTLAGFCRGRNQVVGVLFDRSFEQMVAILATLKAGCAYLPLDPANPSDRLDFMIRDSGIKVLLTVSHLVGGYKGETICLDKYHSIQPEDNLNLKILPSEAAYMIYTSGSTGQPKGVVLTHGGIAGFTCEQMFHLGFTPTSRALQFASPGFDASTWEWTTALCAGAALCLADLATLHPGPDLLNLMTSRRITHALLTPSALAGLPDAELPDLTSLAVGGEACPPDLARRWSKGRRFFNAYGPTEATICASMFAYREHQGRPPIGHPLGNSQVYILNRALELSPIGVPGELTIAGDSLGRGYHERFGLTAEKFVPNPFPNNQKGGERLYRTGDLARFLPDGNIDYLGRIDNQVKLRGFRIESGEIEAVLERDAGVAEAIVILREDRPGDKRLTAYVVPSDADCNPEMESELHADLNAAMQRDLPKYMIPAALVFLAAMPLTPSGKVDRRQLPKPEREINPGSFEAPRNPDETRVAAIWADILGEDQVGIHDNFFELGGHSLLATQAVTRLRDAFEVEVPLQLLFTNPTVAGICEALKDAGSQNHAPPLRPIPRDEPPILSFAQQRLWFLDQLEPQNPFYNIPAQLRLFGEVNIPVLEQTVNEIVRRHESLRTTFTAIEDSARQIIEPELSINLQVKNLTRLNTEDKEHEITRFCREEGRTPFNLECGPLVRASLLVLGSDEYVLTLTLHHIIADGWSMGVILKEMVAIYEAYVQDRPSPLPQLSIQYPDYADWQRQWLQDGVLERQLVYWRQQLTGAPPVLELPMDKIRPPVEEFRGAAILGHFSEPLTQRLNQLAGEMDATLFMVMLSTFKIMLSRYARQTDIVVGSPIANRTRGELEDLIGFFVNTLVLRTDLEGDPTFETLLGRVKKTALDAYAHQDVPFEYLVEALQTERDLSRSPLFQVMFVLQNAPLPEMKVGGFRMERFYVDPGFSKFDLTVFTWEEEGRLAYHFEYNTDLFEAGTIQRMVEHFEILLEAVTLSADKQISELTMISESERKRLLRDWSGRESKPNETVGFYSRIAQTAQRIPNQTALISGEVHLDYVTLMQRADVLAGFLQENGVGPEVIVGIMLDRSPEMVISFLAVLQVGGAVVALDPAYPTSRLTYIISDAQMPILITQTGYSDLVPIGQTQVVCMDHLDLSSGFSATPVEPDLDNLLYAIYTSGSTGNPKGVGVTNRSIQNLLAWQEQNTSMSSPDRTLQFAAFGFCVSFQEILSTWMQGGTLILALEDDRRDMERLLELLVESDVERLHLPFAALKQLAELALRTDRLPTGLTNVVTAGEQLQVTRAIRSLFSQLPQCRLHNQYGASETHVVSALSLDPPADNWAVLPSAGRPISGTRIYLLDERGQLSATGVPGVVHVGGEPVARAYLNRVDLTVEKFIPDPFSDQPGSRLYCTGDLARYRPDGMIQFMGRADEMVKVRGYRVEPGEIDAALRQHDAVADVAVLALKNKTGDYRLAAYVAPANGSLDPRLLSGFLNTRLPAHMVPTAFIEVTHLPITANGKLDRDALPDPGSGQAATTQYEPAKGETEIQLAEIWADILEVERVGRLDDFFALGGHSLLATRVISRIRTVFNSDIPLKALFETPVLCDLAEKIGQVPQLELNPIPLVERSKSMPLSFAQQRLWVLCQFDEQQDGGIYNMPAALQLDGTLDITSLEHAVDELFQRHEILRARFFAEDGIPRQRFTEVSPFIIAFEDCIGEEEAELLERAAAEAHKPFNLATDPLMRLKLLRTGPEQHLLLLTMHHIVSDGWSIGVMIRELSELYEAKAAGRVSTLAKPAIQYVDFAAWQRDHFSGDLLQQELDWWQDTLAGAPTLLELPLDHPRPKVQSFNGDSVSFELGKELVADLDRLALKTKTTRFMLLEAAFVTLLSKYSGSRDISLGTPIANRTRAEVEPLIGFFVNTLVLRTRIDNNASFNQLLASTRTMTLDAFSHQDLPFESLVEAIHPERSLAHSPLFQVMFSSFPEQLEKVKLPNLSITKLEIEQRSAKFDLTLDMSEREQDLTAVFGYNTDLFNRFRIEQMAVQYLELLRSVLAKPNQPLSQIDILAQDERRRILYSWNDTQRNYACELPVEMRFLTQARNTPNALAVRDLAMEGVSATATYAQLAERVEALAAELAVRGAVPEMVIGICTPRSIEMLVGMLGIIHSGAAYLPLDPTLPPDRIKYMLDDAGVSHVVTGDAFSQVFTGQGLDVVSLDRRVGNPDVRPQAAVGSNLAYVIYTSGTTGLPKGVGVSRTALANHCNAVTENFELISSDRVLQFRPFNFDAAAEEIYPTLSIGASLYLRSEEVMESFSAFSNLIERARLTVLNLPAIYWHAWVEDMVKTGSAPPDSLRLVVAGSDKISSERLDQWLDLVKGRISWRNGYGPTETTVSASFFDPAVEKSQSHNRAVSIGRPIGNARFHILNQSGQPVPAGISGQLFIGGRGVARGYVGRPGLTAETFIPDPFHSEPGGRLYATGDLARYSPDGLVMFEGRSDFQIKIRGFRVEPGEIEATLCGHPLVQEALVVPHQERPGFFRLTAYLRTSAADPNTLHAHSLREYLHSHLPEYMIPAAFIVLAAFPLNTNGKVDRKALPAPDAGDLALKPYVAPSTIIERELALIWRDVFNVEKVGIHDNFFDLGGHSLLAAQALARIRKTFEIELSLRFLFEEPTVAQAGKRIEQILKAIDGAQHEDDSDEDREDFEI